MFLHDASDPVLNDVDDVALPLVGDPGDEARDHIVQWSHARQVNVQLAHLGNAQFLEDDAAGILAIIHDCGDGDGHAIDVGLEPAAHADAVF